MPWARPQVEGGHQQHHVPRLLLNGTDYDPEPGGLEDDLGFAAEIHVASLLTFFSEEGHLEPVHLHLEPLEENSTVPGPRVIGWMVELKNTQNWMILGDLLGLKSFNSSRLLIMLISLNYRVL